MSAARRTGIDPEEHYVAPGEIEIIPLTNGWFSVLVGRKVTIKRFNLSSDECAQLVKVLTEQVLADRPAS